MYIILLRGVIRLDLVILLPRALCCVSLITLSCSADIFHNIRIQITGSLNCIMFWELSSYRDTVEIVRNLFYKSREHVGNRNTRHRLLYQLLF